MVHLPLSQHLAALQVAGFLANLGLVDCLACMAESITSQPRGPNFDTNPLRVSLFLDSLLSSVRVCNFKVFEMLNAY